MSNLDELFERLIHGFTTADKDWQAALNHDARLQKTEQQLDMLVSLLHQIEAMPEATNNIQLLIKTFLKSIDKWRPHDRPGPQKYDPYKDGP